MTEVLDPPGVAAHPAVAAAGAVGEAIDALGEANLWSLPERDLLAHRLVLEGLAARLASVTLVATREIDGRGAAETQGAPSTAAWLRAGARVHPAAAKAEVALARALDGDLAETGAALARGELSRAHATEVAAAVAALPAAVPAQTRREAEGWLLEQAGQFNPAELGRLGRHLLAVVDPDLGEALERGEIADAERVGFTLASERGGGARASGFFDPEGAALLRTALDAVAGPRPAIDGVRDQRSPAQRRGEGLLDLIRLALSSPDMPDDGGEPVTLTVTTTTDTLTAHPSDTAAAGLAGLAGLAPGGQYAGQYAGVPAGQYADGTALSPETVRRLGCDAWLVAATLSGTGAVLDIGRATRIVPRSIRRALALRDKGCAFPGCDRPAAWTQAHHILHWARGGVTALHNLVLLCHHHHQVVHHHGWRVHIGDDGLPVFTPPRWVDPDQQPRTRHWRHTLDHLPQLT